MNIFFDTSALVKFFHEEPGTKIVTDLINNPDNNIKSSWRSGILNPGDTIHNYRTETNCPNA
jgi:hypothetical protein